MKHHSSKVIQFVKDFYQKNGGAFCAKRLNLDVRQIYNISQRLGLKLTREKHSELMRVPKFQPTEEYDVNPEAFANIDSPEKAYICGLLWSDGYVKTCKDKSNLIVLSSTMPDAEEIIPIFNKIGRWRIYTGKIGPRCTKPPVRICTNNRVIVSFLRDFNFCDKILGTDFGETLSNELRKYWMLGLWDGDGCFYINQKRGLYRASIAGPLNQNWGFITRFLDNHAISFNIERTYSKSGNYSKVHVTKKGNVCAFGDLLYSQQDLGLSRKRQKYLAIAATLKKLDFVKRLQNPKLGS